VCLPSRSPTVLPFRILRPNSLHRLSKSLPLLLTSLGSVIEKILQSDFEDCDSAVYSFNSFLYKNADKSAKIVKRHPVSKFHKQRVIQRPIATIFLPIHFI
jgi:hypothetical protein